MGPLGPTSPTSPYPAPPVTGRANKHDNDSAAASAAVLFSCVPSGCPADLTPLTLAAKLTILLTTMKLDRYTEKAQEAILAAQRQATDAASPILDAEHILAALLADPEGTPYITLKDPEIGADPAQLNLELAAVLSRRAKIQGGTMSVDPRVQQLIQRAEDEARRLG